MLLLLALHNLCLFFILTFETEAFLMQLFQVNTESDVANNSIAATSHSFASRGTQEPIPPLRPYQEAQDRTKRAIR